MRAGQDDTRTRKAVCLLAAALLYSPMTAHSKDEKETEDNEQSAALSGTQRCEGVTGQVSGAYKGVFYENDFGYLEGDCLDSGDPRDAVAKASDALKEIPLASRIRLSIGGEVRLRFHHEDGIGGSRLDGLDNDFLLSRVRSYANIEITEYFRGFVEVIDARQAGGDLPPRGIEVVRDDVLNGFGEIRLPLENGRVFARAGRQELLLGAQRLVSPLDWGNTRRSFDGFRAGYAQGDFKLTGWFTNPREIRNKSSRRGEKKDFSGVYAGWTGLPGQTIEAYAMNLDTDAAAGPHGNLWTLGARGQGGIGDLRWEIETAVQTGTHEGDDVSAHMVTAGLGADLESLTGLRSDFWIYYDRASGDGDPNDGEHNTFNQLFPLAHAYLGFMDLIGRQNIEALSFKWSYRPHSMLRLHLAGHDFSLENARDALFNAGGAAIRRDPTGAAGTDVGREIDITARLTPLRWLSLEFGYSRFFAGNFIEATNGPGVSGDADFFQTSLTVRY